MKKTFIVTIAIFVAFTTSSSAEIKAKEIREITLLPDKGVIRYVVHEGTYDPKKGFKWRKKTPYTIDLKASVISSKEGRPRLGFSVNEAKAILQILEGFWVYCVQSVEWYEAGGIMERQAPAGAATRAER